MSLLREIQDLSIDTNSDLEALLRKCRVLAARLKNDDLKHWVQWELDGYSKGVEVPDYRKFHCQCAGHFSGPFGREVRNAPIAETSIPEQLRDILTRCELRDGVRSLATTAQNSEKGLVRLAWAAETSALFGADIYENLVLVQGWMRLTTSELEGILSTVRNRILNFALEIEASNPDAGEAPSNVLPVPKEQVAQIFNQYIYGNVGNVAAGHDIRQNATVNVSQGDLKSLNSYLESQGVKSSDLQELTAAVKADGKPSEKGLGKSVSRWLGKMVGKAAEGTWDIAADTAAGLMTEALKSYYGL